MTNVYQCDACQSQQLTVGPCGRCGKEEMYAVAGAAKVADDVVNAVCNAGGSVSMAAWEQVEQIIAAALVAAEGKSS